MACDVHAHVRIGTVRGAMNVCSVMSVWNVQYTTQHACATRACSLNSGLPEDSDQEELIEASARVRHQGRMRRVSFSKTRKRSTHIQLSAAANMTWVSTDR